MIKSVVINFAFVFSQNFALTFCQKFIINYHMPNEDSNANMWTVVLLFVKGPKIKDLNIAKLSTY